MQYFRLRTSEVKAVQVDKENLDEVWSFLGDHIHRTEMNPEKGLKIIIPNRHIEMLEGPDVRFVAKHGDWIVEEAEGDFFVISPKAFPRMFESVNLEGSDGGSLPTEQIMALERITGAIDVYEGIELEYPTAKRMGQLCAELKLYISRLRRRLEEEGE